MSMKREPKKSPNILLNPLTENILGYGKCFGFESVELSNTLSTGNIIFIHFLAYLN